MKTLLILHVLLFVIVTACDNSMASTNYDDYMEPSCSSSFVVNLSSSSYIQDSDFKKICAGILHELLDYSTLSVERPAELCTAEKNAFLSVDFSNDDIARCFNLIDPYCLGPYVKSRSTSNCCKVGLDYDTEFKVRLCNAKKLKGDVDYVECDCSCVE